MIRLEMPVDAEATRSFSHRKILAVDFEVFGHHPAYIQNIADVWVDADLDGSIEFLLTNRFHTVHRDIVNHIEGLRDSRVATRFVSDAEERLLVEPKKYVNGWKIFCDHAVQSRASHGLLMYMDPFLNALWRGQSSPIPFSGIYFRPTFHYHQFEGHRFSLTETLIAWRKKFLLRRILSKPEINGLLSLDATAVPYMQNYFRTNASISHFADSFPRVQASAERIEELRSALGVQPNRVVFCLIGILDERKGPMQLLNAIDLLPTCVAQKTCVLLIGRPTDSVRQSLEDAVADLQSRSKVQLIFRNGYVPPDDVQSYYALSDVMLTTYQFHKGSSSALIRAAYEKKPVLSSGYGWLGHMVRTYKMGVVVDSTKPKEIAQGIEKFTSAAPQSFIDLAKSNRLTAENSQEKLAADLANMLAGKVRDSIPQPGRVASTLTR